MKIAVIDLRIPGTGNRQWARKFSASVGADYYYWHDKATGVVPLPNEQFLPKKVSDKYDVLQPYDLVVLHEAPVKGNGAKFFTDFQDFPTAWTMMIHGFHIKRVQPGLAEMFSQKNYCGKVLSNGKGITQSFCKTQGVELIDVVLPHLPYTLTKRDIPTASQRVVNTSIVTPAKGVVPLSLAALNVKMRLDFKGIPTVGPWGNEATSLLDKLVINHGFTSSTPLDQLRNSPWTVTSPNGSIINCQLGFDTLDNALQDAGVHVDLPSVATCGQKIEYVTLEAIDYGVLPIVPHGIFANGEYEGILAVDYQRPAKYDQQQLASTIQQGLNMPVSERADRIEKLQAFVAKYHDPIEYGKAALKGLGY